VARTPSATPARNYIRNETFDATLLFAPLATGLATAAVVTGNPWLFPVLLLADLWLLGYHHVVATYTRLAFDRPSLKRNRFLAIDLLILVIAATVAVALTAGAWVIASAYLYLQWFHYMRQSYGIARMYFRATPQGQAVGTRDLAADLVIYLVPIFCIAQRSATMGDDFLFMPVKPIVLPDIVIAVLGVAAAVATVAWVLRTAQAAVRGNTNLAYTGFILSHIAIFLTAYIIVDDVNVGWLAINIWHNFQYVLVVWMVNAKRYAGGIDPKARFISRISQPGRAVAYFTSCLLISTAIYLGLNRINALVLGGGLAASLGIYMGINFHHYVVDAFIWKRRRVVATQSA
jgi:hypothetical protein